MTKIIKAIRGMNDTLPAVIPYWQRIESVLKDVATRYGYSEIRFPIVESTDLFVRSIGEVTDIVEKEMYTFHDRNGDSLTLRPEGTAVCVRAVLEHSLTYNQSQRLWYIGPMFRHERPQKGRYRQFYQFGVEAFGLAGPDVDIELIAMSARFWRELGLSRLLRLEINSLGSSACRARYRDQLITYFEKHAALLDEDSQRRLHSNPLRILDSKNPAMQELIEKAPRLIDAIDDESAQHFSVVTNALDALGIQYRVNPRLVRGLDYYNRTVFEWVTDAAGAQNTVCAGGRYDELLTQLGGTATPSAGFAVGIERVVEMLQTIVSEQSIAPIPDAYLIAVGDHAAVIGLQLAEKIRDANPQLRLVVNSGGGSFKNQFKRADKSGATLALILGEEEINNGTIGVKFLRDDRAQQSLSHEAIVSFWSEQ